MGDGGADGADDGTGSDANGDGFREAGPGVELRLEDGDAGVGNVDLLDEEAFLLGSGGGAEDEGLEVGDGL